MELIFEIQGRDERLMLSCRGRLVCGPESEALRATVSRLFTSARHISLDLSNVRKLDCAGLGAIVACMSFAHQHGKSLDICFVPPRILNMIRITGLHRVINVAHASKESHVGVFAA